MAPHSVLGDANLFFRAFLFENLTFHQGRQERAILKFGAGVMGLSCLSELHPLSFRVGSAAFQSINKVSFGGWVTGLGLPFFPEDLGTILSASA
jgi:hypothetical protein